MNPARTTGAVVVLAVFLAIFASCEKTDASIQHAGRSTASKPTVIAQDAPRSVNRLAKRAPTGRP